MSGVLKERDYKNLKQHSIDGSEWKRLVEIVNSISNPANVDLPPNASTLTEQEYQSALLEQLKLSILSYSRDFFGNTVTSQIHNQIEVPFDDINWADYVNLTNVSTGAATQANGEVTLTTGTNANGRYAAISKDIVKYKPNHEIGFGFTWRFNTPSITNVTLSIGSTDNTQTINPNQLKSSIIDSQSLDLLDHSQPLPVRLGRCRTSLLQKAHDMFYHGCYVLRKVALDARLLA